MHVCRSAPGDVLTDEFCIVPASSLKGSEDLLAAARKMSALMQDMFSGLDAPGLKDMASRQPDYDKLGGIPVLTRHFSDGKPAHETVLQSIRKETLPAATFDTPAGYTKKDLPTLRSHERRSDGDARDLSAGLRIRNRASC